MKKVFVRFILKAGGCKWGGRKKWNNNVPRFGKITKIVLLIKVMQDALNQKEDICTVLFVMPGLWPGKCRVIPIFVNS